MAAHLAPLVVAHNMLAVAAAALLLLVQMVLAQVETLVVVTAAQAQPLQFLDHL